MQESILSLMQMAKTSAALAKFDEQGRAVHIRHHRPDARRSVRQLREPWRLLSGRARRDLRLRRADVSSSRRSARSFRTTSRRPNSTCSTVSWTRSFTAKTCRQLLTKLLDTAQHGRESRPMAGDLPFEQPLAELRTKIDDLKRFGIERRDRFYRGNRPAGGTLSKLEKEIYSNLTAPQKMHHRPASAASDDARLHPCDLHRLHRIAWRPGVRR